MFERTSKVDSVNLTSLGSSSLLQLGDSEEIQSVTHALAVHQEKEYFNENNGNFANYSIFKRLHLFTPILDPIVMQTTSLNQIIKVGCINIIALSSSATLHIGNSGHIQTDTRIKHIRQLESGGIQSDQNTEEE